MKRLFLPLLLLVSAVAQAQWYPPGGGGGGGPGTIESSGGAFGGDVDTAGFLFDGFDFKDNNVIQNLNLVYGAGWVALLQEDSATVVPILSDPGHDFYPCSVTGSGVWTQCDQTTILTATSTAAVTNKTYDAAATGNVLKLKSYLQLLRPQRVDGTGAVYQNSDSTQNYFGQALFSNSADQAGNYVEYRLIVPEDIDTSVDLRARFEFRLSATDTGKHRYVISMSDVSDSASSGGTMINAVNLDFAGDASGASGDIETVGWVTLTSWKGSLTAGHHLVIRIARDGDDGTNDTSTVNSYSGPLEIEYGAIQ